jgi:predicted XRE-type DNA-binding protein
MGTQARATDKLKMQLAGMLSESMRAKGLSARKAAQIMHCDNSDLSRLLRGQTDRFSIDRLFVMAQSMGIRVEVDARTA